MLPIRIRRMCIALGAIAIASLATTGATNASSLGALTDIQADPQASNVLGSDQIAAYKITRGNVGIFATGTVDCTTLGDGSHRYLVLDESADNSSRLGRHATYRTGDDRELTFAEHAIPGAIHGGDAFTDAGVFVTVENSSSLHGHASFTLYCAATLEAAHQR